MSQNQKLYARLLHRLTEDSKQQPEAGGCEHSYAFVKVPKINASYVQGTQQGAKKSKEPPSQKKISSFDSEHFSERDPSSFVKEVSCASQVSKRASSLVVGHRLDCPLFPRKISDWGFREYAIVAVRLKKMRQPAEGKQIAKRDFTNLSKDDTKQVEEEGSHWEDLMRLSEERHFSIDRVIRYLSHLNK